MYQLTVKWQFYIILYYSFSYLDSR